MVGIAIILVLVSIGFLISSAIENSVNENNEKYFKALKIDNNEEQFKYALNTNIGYTLSQGTVQAMEPVSINDIDGQYFYIEKEKEKYTKHTRQVAHTRTKSDGTTETYYTTEEYWTWDYAGEESWHTNTFKYLGVTFNYGTINFNNYKHHKETIQESYYIRYQYYVIPISFKTILFTNIKNYTITENEVYYYQTIKDVISVKEDEVNTSKAVFWVIWTLLIGFFVFGFVYMENNYLED